MTGLFKLLLFSLIFCYTLAASKNLLLVTCYLNKNKLRKYYSLKINYLQPILEPSYVLELNKKINN